MPIYEFKCEKCLEEIEIFASVNDLPIEQHCWCGGKLKRYFKTVPALHGIVFTDFRKEYLAHKDDYVGDSEANIRYCEEVTQTSRNDVRPSGKPKQKKRDTRWL